MDFLLIDHVMCSANLNSAEIKSALCAYGVEEDQQVEGWIQRVIGAFDQTKGEDDIPAEAKAIKE